MTSTFRLTSVAMLAFAGNSLLARLALSPEDGRPAIDAAGFTGLRLASGALFLAVVLFFVRRRAASDPGQRCVEENDRMPGSWISAAALFVYATSFSFAYARIGAAVGALVLFTSVQATMICAGLSKGEKPTTLELLGLLIAFGAFAWWIYPRMVTPEIAGTGLMIASGAAWGVYSLRGRGSRDPVAATAGNFIRTLPLSIPLITFSTATYGIALEGSLVALASGVIASALGYIVWYRALPQLTATRAAIVQLSVPVIAAAGGVVFLGETLTARFAVASVLILGGIAMAVSFKASRPPAGVRCSAGTPR